MIEATHGVYLPVAAATWHFPGTHRIFITLGITSTLLHQQIARTRLPRVAGTPDAGMQQTAHEAADARLPTFGDSRDRCACERTNERTSARAMAITRPAAASARQSAARKPHETSNRTSSNDAETARPPAARGRPREAVRKYAVSIETAEDVQSVGRSPTVAAPGTTATNVYGDGRDCLPSFVRSFNGRR
jgi:hypothetical protein